MDKKSSSEIITTLTTSLENTQKTSIDMEDYMGQVCTLSSQTSHDKAIDALIADTSLDWETKVTLKRQMETDHNQTLRENSQTIAWAQAAQTQNVLTATTGWTQNIGMLLTGGVLAVGLLFPNSRKLITSTAKHLNTPAGKRALRTLDKSIRESIPQCTPGGYVTAGQTTEQ